MALYRDELEEEGRRSTGDEEVTFATGAFLFGFAEHVRNLKCLSGHDLPSGTIVGQSKKTNIHVELASAIHEMFQMTNIVVIDASKSHSS